MAEAKEADDDDGSQQYSEFEDEGGAEEEEEEEQQYSEFEDEPKVFDRLRLTEVSKPFQQLLLAGYPQACHREGGSLESFSVYRTKSQ